MATFSRPRETWNERFAGPDYLFGEEPNAFVRDTALRHLRPGQTALCVADGEGRNSVWLAEQGVVVTAFDFAENAVRKAKALARRRGVAVDHRLSSFEAWAFGPAGFDAVVAIFIQFLDPVAREAAFASMKSAVRPGGHFLLEGYRPKQLEYGTGGPGAVENLYTREWIERTFADWDVLELREYDAELAEGKRHVGMSALVDVVARRTA
jgi:SAM-dependent methyltransferase